MTTKIAISEFNFTVDRENKRIIMERIFDAPPDLVFRAHTDTKLIPQWWTDIKVAELDVRSGGKWRFVSEGDEQQAVSNGEFKNIVPDERIVESFNMGSFETVNTTSFEKIGDAENKTRLTKIVEFNSIEDLESLVNYGMQEGARAGYEKLAKLLSILRDNQ